MFKEKWAVDHFTCYSNQQSYMPYHASSAMLSIGYVQWGCLQYCDVNK